VLRKPWTANQVKALYRGLTDPSYKGWTTVYLAAYGCQVNTVAPSATAVAQRDSILKVWFSGGWADAAEDAAQIDWIRRFYRSVHEETGGVPVPNDNQDGSFINYPDVDLRDPNWNTSGVPWHTLYYKDNYPKLQRVKAKYDPLNVFGHALGIQA
jgi:aclacinomycin oxidase